MGLTSPHGQPHTHDAVVLRITRPSWETHEVAIPLVWIDPGTVHMGPPPPHESDPRASWRIALRLWNWAEDNKGHRLGDLDPVVLATGMALADALSAALQAHAWGGEGEQHEGQYAFLDDAVSQARRIVQNTGAWSQIDAEYSRSFA
jgi:hypothetical protein